MTSNNSSNNTTGSTSSGAMFGELVLVLGDLHIPERAVGIPPQFKRMLVPNKMQHLICTGNLGGTATSITTSTSTSTSTVTAANSNTNTFQHPPQHSQHQQQPTQQYPQQQYQQQLQQQQQQQQYQQQQYLHQQQPQQQQQQQQMMYPNNHSVGGGGIFQQHMQQQHQPQVQQQMQSSPATPAAAIAVASEQYEELLALAPNVHIVAGDYDNIGNNNNNSNDINGNNDPTMTEFPETAIVTVGLFTIGIVHGHQIIPWNDPHSYDRIHRKLSCTNASASTTGTGTTHRPIDILITGHTHKSFVTIKSDYYHINPGSITGAYSSLLCSNEDENEVIPSFVLLDIKLDKVTCYLYELIDGEVSISKTELPKR